AQAAGRRAGAGHVALGDDQLAHADGARELVDLRLRQRGLARHRTVEIVERTHRRLAQENEPPFSARWRLQLKPLARVWRDVVLSLLHSVAAAVHAGLREHDVPIT